MRSLDIQGKRNRGGSQPTCLGDGNLNWYPDSLHPSVAIQLTHHVRAQEGKEWEVVCMSPGAVSLRCQLDWLWSHLGEKPLGTSVKGCVEELR